MKKIGSIGFAFVYVFLVSGGTLCFHYCGGRVASVNLPLFTHFNACSCEKKMMKSNCCKNKNIHLSIKGEQEPASVIVAEVDFVPVFVSPFVVCNESYLPVRSFSVISDYHPPSPRSNSSLLIWNRVFRV